jgi:hypothetical protein
MCIMFHYFAIIFYSSNLSILPSLSNDIKVIYKTNLENYVYAHFEQDVA